jgi:3'-phosphoadenosine 5'-phosphosulfate sulfotransferase (PAPS reductase)/FAD synthetase
MLQYSQGKTTQQGVAGSRGMDNRSSCRTIRFEKEMPMIEWLEDKQLYKFNPLLNWTFAEVMDYLKEFYVPYNPLHDKGFVSIGCAPCTRAIEPGEDPRAGRWWWETSQKECGLHVQEVKQPNNFNANTVNQ